MLTNLKQKFLELMDLLLDHWERVGGWMGGWIYVSGLNKTQPVLLCVKTHPSLVETEAV